jgi:hypothetical protein
MLTSDWRRVVARIVLFTFTWTLVAWGGSPGEVATTIATARAEQIAQAPPAPSEPPPTLPSEPPELLSKEELRELVAPVALYPDVVLASLLPATTNPDQIAEAARYIGDSRDVEDVPDDVTWDGSVIGLLQFPDVLRWLDQNPAWTDEMGFAVTYQQGDVLQAIQDYRREVMNAGNLKSNEYYVVRGAPERDILIEPARPDIVYVPSYDPVAAVQPQPVVAAPGINPWIAFGGGAVVGALGAFALYSIFDDDVEVHHHHHGGGRRIRGYNNYYYARGRRPATVDWTPRARGRRARPAARPRPRRLEHMSTTAPSRRAPLRAPSTRRGGDAPRPGQLRREHRQERREQRRDLRQDRRDQRQENRGQRRDQRQDKRQQRQMQRQDRQEHKQEQQLDRREQRQDRREQQQMQRQENRQERRTERDQRQDTRQQRRQEQRGQRQENRQERQMQRQERREQRQENRQGGGGGGGKKKKSQGQD